MKGLKFKFWRLFKKYWPFIVFFLLTLLFFNKVIFKGLVPIPADITVGLYYPWLDYKWGYETAVPVKNNLPSDIVSVHLPFRIFAAEQIRQGIIPLWNNLVLSGTPLVANFQSGIFYPLNLLLAITSTINAWSIQVMLQPFLVAIFTFQLLRNWRLSKTSSLFGAIAFGFTGYLLVWLEYNIHGHVAYWLPAILIVVDKFFYKQKMIYAALLSIFVAMALLAGYPQMVIYEAIAVAIYLAFRVKEKDWFKKVMQLSVFAVLGLIVAAVQILPAYELLQLSNRLFDAQTIAVANQGFLPYKHLLGFFSPDYFGNPSTGNWWGVGFYDNFTGYASIVALTLAIVGVIGYIKRFEVKFLTATFFVSILLAIKSPLSILLFESNFLGFQAAVASRALFLSGFSIAVLSAFGVEGILKLGWNKNKLRATYPAWIVLIGVGIGTLVTYIVLRTYSSNAFNFIEAKETLAEIAAPVVVSLRNLVFPLALIFSVSILLLLAKFKTFRKPIVFFLFALLIFDLFRFGYKYITFSRREWIFPKTPVISFLMAKMQSEGPFRVAGGDVIPMNMMAPFGLETMEGYDAYYSLDYAKFLSKINRGDPNQPLGRYGDINLYDSELMDIGNVKYVLALKRDKIAVPYMDGIPNYKFNLDKFSPVFEDRTVLVLENKNVYDRVFFEKGSGDIKFLEYQPKNIKLAVNSQTDSEMVISQTFYPGWKAYVDGKPVEIKKSHDVYESINVQRGAHVVEFIYNPESFRIGIRISLSALALVVGVIYYEKSLKNRFRITRKRTS